MKRKYLIVTIVLSLVLGLFAATTEAPVSTDYVVEEQIYIEDWMTHPFQSDMYEPLEVEEWMTKPFITN